MERGRRDHSAAATTTCRLRQHASSCNGAAPAVVKEKGGGETHPQCARQEKERHRDINVMAIGRSKDTIATHKGNVASLKREKRSGSEGHDGQAWTRGRRTESSLSPTPLPYCSHPQLDMAVALVSALNRHGCLCLRREMGSTDNKLDRNVHDHGES